ncbi:hypothetical protein DPMN_104926 [Dreissena polymorpha]|uniref:Uncharacterized protein n=1 Tax=Dreissena polymorpha TaxID=45954 RepID=A0A9D4HDY8_DREPO|nr:hypothetical protein DPMN_104926 [Dreissena polymorpha]
MPAKDVYKQVSGIKKRTRMRHLTLQFEKNSGGGSPDPHQREGYIPSHNHPLRRPNVNLLPTYLILTSWDFDDAAKQLV